MTPQDIEQIEREAKLHLMTPNPSPLYVVDIESLSRVVALVLEKAAKTCQEGRFINVVSDFEQGYNRCSDECIEALRAMAGGLK